VLADQEIFVNNKKCVTQGISIINSYENLELFRRQKNSRISKKIGKESQL
jgi:hypothetical protein